MKDQDEWICETVDAAASKAADAKHTIPDHLKTELKRLLEEELRTALKQADIDAVAKALLAKSELK